MLLATINNIRNYTSDKFPKIFKHLRKIFVYHVVAGGAGLPGSSSGYATALRTGVAGEKSATSTRGY